MSLQIWLPFNGNLVNQGVYNSTITSTSPQYSTSGKIGKALSLASNGNYTVKTTYTQNNNEMSICFWVNPNNPGIWTDIFSFGGNNRMEVSSDDKKSYTWYVDSGKQGLISSGTYLFGLNLSTWSHVVIAIDTSSVYFYVNGTLTKTVTRLSTTLANIFAENAFFYVGARVANSQCYSGLINDFRVYDECLSPKQVKEISKGLVLHLPCDGGGRGANNLVNGSNTNSVDTNGFGYSEQTGGSTRTIEYDGGIPCVKITRNTTAHSGWDYFWYNKFRISEIKVNTTYVVSFDAIGSGSGSIGLSGFINGNGTNTITESVTTVSNSFNASTWSHIQFITKTKSSFDGISVGSQVVYMSCGFLRTASTWVKLKNMKVTEGTTESSWMPSVSDTAYTKMGYDKTTEYDTSGYSRHGVMKNGTYAGNQARYSACASLLGTTVDTTSNTITGAQWFVAPITLAQTKYITFAWWSKGISYGRGGIFCTTNSISGDVPNTDYNTTAVCNWDSTFRLYTVGGTAFNFWTQYSNAVSDNTWHHHAITYDGTTARYYQDGVQKNSAAINSEIPAFSGICMGLGRAGGVYRQIKEYANDVRIYVTALSADDIKDLYQTSASIDNKGNILGYDMQE